MSSSSFCRSCLPILKRVTASNKNCCCSVSHRSLFGRSRVSHSPSARVRTRSVPPRAPPRAVPSPSRKPATMAADPGSLRPRHSAPSGAANPPRRIARSRRARGREPSHRASGPRGDASHARGVDDASRSARHQVVTSATPSHGSSVIDAVVDAAVDASMETEEARLEDVFSGKDDEADDEADARVVSSDVPAAKTPPSLERRAPPPPAPRGRGASGEAEVFRDADVSLVSLDEGDATVPRDGIENRPDEPSGVEKTNASASASPAKTKTLSVTTNPLTSSALFARASVRLAPRTSRR